MPLVTRTFTSHSRLSTKGDANLYIPFPPLSPPFAIPPASPVAEASAPALSPAPSARAGWASPLSPSPSPTHISRVGLSLLSNLDLLELVAATPAEYFHIAQSLAADLPRLRHLRQTLYQRMTNSPLTQAKPFTRRLEEAFRTLPPSPPLPLTLP